MLEGIVSAVGELPTFQVDVNVVRSWVQFAAEVVAVAVIILGVRRRSDRKQAERLESLITTATQPIQPGYRNGGESLGDIAAELKTVKSSVSELRTAHDEHRVIVLDVRERVANLTDKVEQNRKAAVTSLAALSSVVAAQGAATAVQSETGPPVVDGPDLD